MVNVKPVTLYDVAEYAGVSYQTVSRVVNQASHVSAKTREKVEAAMAELNYIPNRVAQQLAGKQSLLIGVATSSLALHAPSQIVAAIKSRADQLGASVVVSMVERSGVEACKAAVHNLLAQRVSGLIINYPLDDQDAIAVEAACTNVPALFLDVSDQTPINSIIFSHEDGTRLGVEHLVALGHQQIALLAGPLSSVSARLRLAGWLGQCRLYRRQRHSLLPGAAFRPYRWRDCRCICLPQTDWSPFALRYLCCGRKGNHNSFRTKSFAVN